MRRTAWLLVTLAGCPLRAPLPGDLTDSDAAPSVDAASRVDAAPALDASPGLDGGEYSIIVLAADQITPSGIAVDATHVYWTAGGYSDQGTVMSCAIDGCGGAPQTIASGQKGPGAILVDGGSLYWATTGTNGYGTDGSVSECATTGCEMARAVYAGEHPLGIAIDASHVYMTIISQGIASCDRSGCGGTATTMAASADPASLDIVLSGTTLVWATSTPLVGDAIVSCDVGSCTPSTLVSGADIAVAGIATDGVNVYWTNHFDTDGHGAVMTCPIAGCGGAPSILVAGVYFPLAIASDGAGVFFTTAPMAPGGVFSCPVDGCSAPDTLAAGPLVFSPGAIAVDATSVYWTDFYTGLVAKTRKVRSRHSTLR